MESKEEYRYYCRLINELRRKYALGFVFNPGGGEFNAPGFRCQVSGMSAREDHETLVAALKKRGMWTEGESE